MVTSNREPIEWLAEMADPLLAQSAVDRLKSAAYELVLDGESYRQREKPTLESDPPDDPPPQRDDDDATFPLVDFPALGATRTCGTSSVN